MMSSELEAKKTKIANFSSQGKRSAVRILISFEKVPILMSPYVEVVFSNGKQPHSFSISLPLSLCVNSSPALFSLILCLAFKQRCNVRRPLSILIKSTIMGELKQLLREKERERDGSIEGIKLHLFRVYTVSYGELLCWSLNDSYISLSAWVQLSLRHFWLNLCC